MTTVIKKYIGLTHPLSKDKRLSEREIKIILKAWKESNCCNGIHLLDEVLSDYNHYLICDACGMEVHIEKIIIPDNKDDIIK